MRNPATDHTTPSAFASRAARTIVLAVVIVGCLSYAVHAAVKRLAAPAPRHGSLTVSGTLAVPLAPGTARPIDVRLTNTYPFALTVRRINVRLAVDGRHRRAGCSASRDFAVRQIPQRQYPIAVPASAAATLSDLGVRALPRLAMVNRPLTDQGSCRGASLVLRYRAIVARQTRRSSSGP